MVNVTADLSARINNAYIRLNTLSQMGIKIIRDPNYVAQASDFEFAGVAEFLQHFQSGNTTRADFRPFFASTMEDELPLRSAVIEKMAYLCAAFRKAAVATSPGTLNDATMFEDLRAAFSNYSNTVLKEATNLDIRFFNRFEQCLDMGSDGEKLDKAHCERLTKSIKDAEAFQMQRYDTFSDGVIEISAIQLDLSDKALEAHSHITDTLELEIAIMNQIKKGNIKQNIAVMYDSDTFWSAFEIASISREDSQRYLMLADEARTDSIANAGLIRKPQFH